MASRYAVAGTTWDGTGTTWALTDGAAPTEADPTAADDVFLTAASGAITVTVAAAATCKDLDCSGFTGTLAGSSTLAVSGTTFKLVSGMGYTYTGSMTFNATAGTCNITSGTKTMDHDVTFDGVGGTWSLADTCVWGATRTWTLTNGAFDANNQNWGVGLVSSSNSNTRSITFGSGTCSLSGVGAITVLEFSTPTGLTLTTNTGTFDLTGNTASTRTCNVNASLAIPNLKISAGSGSVVWALAGGVANFTMTSGYTGAFGATNGMGIGGSLSFNAANAAITASAGLWSFWGQSGTDTIDTGGIACDVPWSFSQYVGAWKLLSTTVLGATRALTLNMGTFDANNQNWSVGTVASSNSNVRVFTTGSGTCSVLWAGIATPVVTFSTATNLTFTANTATFDLTGNTANAREVIGGSIAAFPSLKISNGSDATVTTAVNCLDYTQTAGYTGALANNAMTIRGSLSLNAANGTPTAGANAWTFASTFAGRTVNTGGKTCAFPWTFNGSGGGWALAANASTGGAYTTTLTSGALNLAGFTLITGLFTGGAGSATRSLTFGSGGVFEIASVSATTVWSSSTATNFTITGTGGTLKLSGGISAGTRTVAASTSHTNMPSLLISGGSGSHANAMTGYVQPYTASFSHTVASSGSISVQGSCEFGSFTTSSLHTGQRTCSTSALKIKGNYSTHANNGTWTSSTGTITFAPVGATTITVDSAGNTWGNPVTIDATADTGVVQLLSAFTSSVTTRLLTVTRGILDLNGFNMSMSRLTVTSGAVTRGIAFGNGILSLTSVAAVTIVSQNGSSGTITHTYGTGYIDITGTDASTRSLLGSNSAGFALPNLRISGAGAGAWNVSLADTRFSDLTFINTWVSTWPNTAINVGGNLVIPATGGTFTAGANAWTFGATSVKQHTVSRAVDWPFIIDGVGGSFYLGANLTIGNTRTITLTNGTLHCYNYTLAVGALSSSNANVRVLHLYFNSVLSLTNASGVTTVLDLATSTNFILSASGGAACFIDLSGANSSTRTINGGSIGFPALRISAGTGAVTLTSIASVIDLILTSGYTTGALSNTALTIRNSLTLDAANGALASGANVWTFDGGIAAGRTITSGGQVLDFPITFADVVAGFATWLLVGALNITARALTLTQGTIDAATNNVALTAGNFACSNSNTREVKLGTATHIFSGATMSAWDCATSTNLTVTRAASGTIKLTGTTPTFAGGSKSYRNLWFSAGSTTYTITGSNTFGDLKAAA